MTRSSIPERIVDVVWLSGGGLLLALHGRSEKSGADGAAQKENARIITIVWGDSYLEHLMNFAIPSVLAPGNLPCVAENFRTELVIVTETRLFDRITQSSIIARALQHCDVRLHPIDDLISTHYGITLTNALVRGFADLGEDIVNTHLIFFNSDFIIGDGSYRKLLDLIRLGKRLVLSPSYCLVYEDAIAELRNYYDDSTCTLSISQRDLAALILSHRHKTTRAKTMNQRLFRHHRYDQFYWYVDDHTMLARMMPVPTVYMRPEQPLTEPDTFWDYGTIAEYCPTTVPYVLADSDEFLMGEFREALALKDLFTLGFPTDKEIIADLSSFTTQYHRDHSKHTLVLHSRPLPAAIDFEKQRFIEVTDAILGKLSLPVDSKNHKFWVDSFPQFLAAREAGKAKLQARERAHAAEVKAKILRTKRTNRVATVIAGNKSLSPEQQRRRQDIERKLQELDQRRLQLDGLLGARTAEVETEGVGRIVSAEPPPQSPACDDQDFPANSQQIAQFYSRITKLITVLQGIESEIKAARVDIEHRRLELLNELRLLTAPNLQEATTLPAVAALPPNNKDAGSIMIQTGFRPALLSPRWLHRLFRLLCGSRVNPRITHPYFLVLRQIKHALTKAAGGRLIDLLVICSDNFDVDIITAGFPVRRMVIVPVSLVDELNEQFDVVETGFDVCLCSLSFENLKLFRGILDKTMPFLRDPAKFLVSYFNIGRHDLAAHTNEFTQTLFPLVGASAIGFSGSASSIDAIRWCRLGARFASRPWGTVPAALAGSISILLALVAAWRESQRPGHIYPLHCTSMTIEIDLPPASGRRQTPAGEIANERALLTAAASS